MLMIHYKRTFTSRKIFAFGVIDDLFYLYCFIERLKD